MTLFKQAEIMHCLCLYDSNPLCFSPFWTRETYSTWKLLFTSL